MRRRAFLAALGGVTLGGCAGLPADGLGDGPPETTDDNSPTPYPESPTPRELPSRPETFERESIREYVKHYEQVALFNELAEDGAWNISLGEGTAVVDLLAENRAYAYATCAGSYRGPEGAYADFGRGPSVYLVNESSTNRVGRFQIDEYEFCCSDVYGSDGETEPTNPVGVGVINLGSQRRETRIRVRYLDADGEPLIYDETDTVTQGHGLLHRQITEKPGSYEIEASFEPDVSASAEWEVPMESHSIGWQQTIFITPQGKVRIRDTPFDRLFS